MDNSGNLPRFFVEIVDSFTKAMDTTSAEILQALNALTQVLATEAPRALVGVGGLVDRLLSPMIKLLLHFVKFGHGQEYHAIRREVVQFLRMAIIIRPINARLADFYVYIVVSAGGSSLPFCNRFSTLGFCRTRLILY